MRGLDYRWIEALEAVVSYGNFERAAEALFVSQSAVSQRVKQLEKFLAQPVLVREQPPKPTPVGQKLLALYQQVQLLESEFIPELDGNRVAKVQRAAIATNADSLATWLLPALAPVMKSRDIELNLAVYGEGRTLDKLKNGEVIGALSMEPKAMAGCEANYLGRMDYVCVASPEFAATYFPNGVNREALLQAPAVSFDQYDQLHRDFLKLHFNISSDSVTHHHVASSEAFVNLALMGCAYCLIPKLQIEAELASGKLVDLMPDFFMSFRIYWHHWQLETRLLSEITQAIINHTKELLPK
ncbi:chromosome replication initiation inhibitor protein [Vibrio orientalis CIP 102891 = ATCC 33934]|uniref:HTH-type transcriptional regulator ArgP n=1 Tax=Vibrio orientalis CIP 102891 = ATCC 33934 TaxID=675816 RepID=C9QC89_VIBOR|nr:LysR family transcriptional regulator ArgP [Vibrio orientalis]EEX95285.1 chromosome initiation inhibitor [Vibrio orientalis CIP 102891 = ATCC 33934]EGU52324.1 chromosome replication initiation inhibitor protein [Vibrio orientalis CIP 102891 = ATCC 33934]